MDKIKREYQIEGEKVSTKKFNKLKSHLIIDEHHMTEGTGTYMEPPSGNETISHGVSMMTQIYSAKSKSGKAYDYSVDTISKTSGEVQIFKISEVKSK